MERGGGKGRGGRSSKSQLEKLRCCPREAGVVAQAAGCGAQAARAVQGGVRCKEADRRQSDERARDEVWRGMVVMKDEASVEAVQGGVPAADDGGAVVAGLEVLCGNPWSCS